MIVYRDAKREDCPQIRKLIQELAEYEEMPDGPKISVEDLERDGFETNPPLFKGYVAEANGKIIGHALYYTTYSTWEGKSMFLEDLYVTPTHRNSGIGSKLFHIVSNRATEEGCSRLQFLCLNWNPAQEMYKARGAVDLTKSEAWHLFRLSGEELKKFQYPA